MPGHFKAWTLWAAAGAAVLAGVFRQSWLFGVGTFILLVGFEVGSLATHLHKENHKRMPQTTAEDILASDHRLWGIVSALLMVIGLLIPSLL